MHSRIVVSMLATAFLSACAAKKPAATPPQAAPRAEAQPTPEEQADATLAADARDLPLSLDAVYFEFDSVELRAEAQGYLRELAGQLRGRNDVEISVEGHCDERGTSEYNMALGERRARVVAEYLARLGVDGARLRHVSYGEERPAASGHDESAYARNRRSELVPRPSRVATGSRR